MILWFRFFISIIRGLIKGRIDVMEPCTSSYFALPIWDSELKYLNAARYLSFAELAINEANVRNGFLRNFIKSGLMGITCNNAIHYIRPVKILKKFSVTTTVIGWDEVFFYRKVQVYQSGKFCFEALYKILVSNGKKKFGPVEVLRLMGSSINDSPELPKEVELLNYRADKP